VDRLASVPHKPQNCKMDNPPAHPVRYAESPERINPVDGVVFEDTVVAVCARRESVDDIRRSQDVTTVSHCVYRNDADGLWLYQSNCLAFLDAIAAKYPGGCFDMIFADPPYCRPYPLGLSFVEFLSNGGITCHAGRMVKVDKGDWDKSQGAQENHNFNRAWLHSLFLSHGRSFIAFRPTLKPAR